ncbi:hypothetical protein [Streptomyces violascens]|uniref:hypothetical protein n=1 Tax=Streptomyces violascens TaxID=67381 RepID=UPI0036823A24
MSDTDYTQEEPEIVIVPIPAVDYDWFGPADHDNPISRLVDDRIDDHEYNGLGRIANLIQ